jgi:hypothetical protein
MPVCHIPAPLNLWITREREAVGISPTRLTST